MFSVHTTPDEFKESCNHRPFWILSQDYRNAIAPFRKCFPSTYTKTKCRPVFSKSSGWKSVFEKLRICKGLMWNTGLTVFKFLWCNEWTLPRFHGGLNPIRPSTPFAEDRARVRVNRLNLHCVIIQNAADRFFFSFTLETFQVSGFLLGFGTKCSSNLLGSIHLHF